MENHHQFPNEKKAMEEELMRGRDMADLLLQVLVDKSNTIHHGKEIKGSKLVLQPFAEDLVRKVLRSFTNSLLLLNTNEDAAGSLTTKCPKMEIMDKTCKRPETTLITKNRRGCYKRKRSHEPTWEKDSSILVEDGHAWRKYGQKMTSNAKYIRSYYKCTYNYDQGCQAIKQVQRIQEHPPLYRTTYYGHHTCKSSFNPEIILEPVSCLDSSTMLNFNNSSPNKQENPFSSSLATTMKEESIEVMAQDDQIAQNQLSLPENILFYDDEIYFDYLRHIMISSNEFAEFDNIYGQF